MKMTFLFLALGLLSNVAWAQSLDLIYKNNAAARTFKAEKKLEAYEQFLTTLVIDPYDPTVQFNVGTTLFALGEEEKSEKLYQQLLKDIDLHLQKGLPQEEQQKWLKIKFAVLYNLGVFYQVQKNIPQALENYQKALELIPDSKEIKTNIELMFKSGGGGGGKGEKDKDNKGEPGDDKKEGEGEGDQEKDQKDQSQGERTNKPQGQGQEFDEKQLSMEDLKRIMEELKQQEQGVRAKVQRKGPKSEPKEKQW